MCCEWDRRFKGLGLAIICILWIVPCVLVFSPFWYSWNWVDRGCAFPDATTCGWNCQNNPLATTATSTSCSWCNSATYPNTPLCVSDATNSVYPAGFNCNLLNNATVTGTTACNLCLYTNVGGGFIPATGCYNGFSYNMMQNLSDNGILAVAVVFTVLCAIGIFMLGIVQVFCCNRHYYQTPGGLDVKPETAGAIYRPAVGGAASPAAAAGSAAV